MVYAAREFRWLAVIQICTELVVYLPFVGLAQAGYFGELELSSLLWVDVAVEASRIVCQGLVALRGMRRVSATSMRWRKARKRCGRFRMRL